MPIIMQLKLASLVRGISAYISRCRRVNPKAGKRFKFQAHVSRNNLITLGYNDSKITMII